MPDVVLKLGNEAFAGWQAIQVTRSIDHLSGWFELSVTERWPGQTAAMRIKPGLACQVLVEDEPVITGYVDDVDLSYGAGEHQITVRGRDKTGDLVDCAAQHKGSEWHRATLKQIAQDLCAPFGIQVKLEVDANPRIRRWSIEPGEAVFENLERMARLQAVLLMSDGLGSLVIARAGTERIATPLVLGQNILTGSGSFSWKERFRDYVVKGQMEGEYNAFKGAAVDKDIDRYRPLIVLAEDQGDIATFTRRAEWERNVRYGRSMPVTYALQGWKHRDGLWAPNKLVTVQDPWIATDELGPERLIVSVTYSLDERGRRSQLKLMPREAWDLIPLPDKKAEGAS